MKIQRADLERMRLAKKVKPAKPRPPRPSIMVDLLTEELRMALLAKARAHRTKPSTYVRALVYLATVGGHDARLPIDEVLNPKN